jgi:hypothetical protein
MKLSTAITLVRQYAELSRRRTKSYAPQVDTVATMLKKSEADLLFNRTLSDAQIDALMTREYPDALRELPSP